MSTDVGLLEKNLNFNYTLPRGIGIFTETMSIATIFINAFDFYLIIFKSPKEMSTHRWFILSYLVKSFLTSHLQTASFLYDLQMFSLSKIVLFMPLLLMQTSGILSTWFHIPAEIQIVKSLSFSSSLQCLLAGNICFISTCSTSIFFYRFQLFLRTGSIFKLGPRIFLSCVLLFGLIPPIAAGCLLYTVCTNTQTLSAFMLRVRVSSNKKFVGLPIICFSSQLHNWTGPLPQRRRTGIRAARLGVHWNCRSWNCGRSNWAKRPSCRCSSPSLPSPY